MCKYNYVSKCTHLIWKLSGDGFKIMLHLYSNPGKILLRKLRLLRKLF